jgi:hypothetical protein
LGRLTQNKIHKKEAALFLIWNSPFFIYKKIKECKCSCC